MLLGDLSERLELAEAGIGEEDVYPAFFAADRS
jgi:hypothetical protein